MALSLFYSYSHKDSDFRDRLQTHLAQLVRNGQIEPWHDRCIAAGDEWRDQIDEHLRSAQIVLLLISSDFLASDYCYGVEMKAALERHTNKQSIVIPIILRPVDWAGSPFAHLQALPQDAKAITLWTDQDQAFSQVAQAIRDIVVRYQQPAAQRPALASELTEQTTSKPRVLDAAMPDRIVKGRATELLVLIRLPESAGLAGLLQVDDEAEAKPEDVRSKPFDVTFPLGPTGQLQPLKVSVQLTAPDFALSMDRKNLFVPVNRDSEVCPFVLTPLKTGPLLVIIELMWEDAERGYRRLKTNCLAEAEDAANPAMNVVQMPLTVLRSERGGGSAIPAAGYAPPQDEATGFMPPAVAPPQRLPERRSAPISERGPAPKSSFVSSPLVRAAAALCLLTLGGTFFVVQRSGTPAAEHVQMTGGGKPGQATSTQIDSAAVEFQQLSRKATVPERSRSPASEAAIKKPMLTIPPQVAAQIKIGKENLAAARAALAVGNKAEAEKHLALVRAANKNLTAHLARINAK